MRWLLLNIKCLKTQRLPERSRSADSNFQRTLFRGGGAAGIVGRGALLALLAAFVMSAAFVLLAALAALGAAHIGTGGSGLAAAAGRTGSAGLSKRQARAEHHDTNKRE